MDNWRDIATILILSLLVNNVQGQANAQSRIPKSLLECYANDFILTRDNRLPMTMDVLIDLIRKIEDGSSYTQDLRTLPKALLYHFRQDGIQKSTNKVARNLTVPFSPKGFQFAKHSILLSMLLEPDGRSFPNNTLTTIESCSLHALLSSTVDTIVRGDEATVCGQLARYRAMRVPRSLRRESEADVDDDDDTGGIFRTDPEVHKEVGFIDTNLNAISQCPMESGVIYTPWGAVSGGNLLSGLAAGLQPQSVLLGKLFKPSARKPLQRNIGENDKIFNIHGATFAGDLAEVVLLQGPYIERKTVGAVGAWNSTILPRWYFLSQQNNFEITDAEIRGSLDGLIMGRKISEWIAQDSSLKLSQLLDMYYSQRGVLASNIRACDRRKLFAEVAPLEELKEQTKFFALLLDNKLLSDVTISVEGINQYTDAFVNMLSTYVPQSLNDPTCQATEWEQKAGAVLSTAVDLHLFIDSTFSFNEIDESIGFVLGNINVNPFGSNVTIYNATDGHILVNSTNSISDIYQAWNVTTHKDQFQSLDLPKILQILHQRTGDILTYEKSTKKISGRSLVSIIVVKDAIVEEGSAQTSEDLVRILHEERPDLELFFLTSGSAERFKRFVKDEKKDLFTLSVGTGTEMIVQNMKPLVKRIKEIPRRITNPTCGTEWSSDEQLTMTWDAYVNPGEVNIYRIQPNYFFGSDENRRIKLQKSGSPDLTICYSRKLDSLLSQNNSSDNDLECDKGDKNSVDISLSNFCADISCISDCNPLYISVKAGAIKSTNQMNCKDNNCRFPDTVKLSIQAESLGCYSDARCLVGSVGMVFVCILLRWFLSSSA